MIQTEKLRIYIIRSWVKWNMSKELISCVCIERCNFAQLTIYCCHVTQICGQKPVCNHQAELGWGEAVIFRYLWNFIINFNYRRTDSSNTQWKLYAHSNPSTITSLKNINKSLNLSGLKRWICNFAGFNRVLTFSFPDILGVL